MPRTRRASQGGYCYHVLNRNAAGEKGPEIFTDLLETRDHVASLANVSHVAGRDATVSCDVV